MGPKLVSFSELDPKKRVVTEVWHTKGCFVN